MTMHFLTSVEDVYEVLIMTYTEDDTRDHYNEPNINGFNPWDELQKLRGVM